MLNGHKKMNLKDKAFLEKFRVKESNILIDLENFGAIFPLWAGWVGTPPINQQMTKSPPIRILPAKFLHPPHESLTTPIFT